MKICVFEYTYYDGRMKVVACNRGEQSPVNMLHVMYTSIIPWGGIMCVVQSVITLEDDTGQ